MEYSMFYAVREGKDRTVAKIIRDRPDIDINSQDFRDFGFGHTFLHEACRADETRIVSLLLKHPKIDVNKLDQDEWTPFYMACNNDSRSCVRLLLKDSRVDVTKTNNCGIGPLHCAALQGYSTIIKMCVASGRVDDPGPSTFNTEYFSDGERKTYFKNLTVLSELERDPENTRFRVRAEIGWFDEAAADMFALVIFLCDGLLALTKAPESDRSTRFFSIAGKLPLEIQMILCYCVAGFNKEVIPAPHRERAFKELGRSF